jgi:hypothetical protein
MAVTGDKISWASTVVGDVSPPLKAHRPPWESKALAQVTVSLPQFNGRYKPNAYIEWEFELNAIFVYHNFSEHTQFKSATSTSTFTDFAYIWWNEYCRSYPDYIPTT